jgi:hypothetical protein
MEDPLDKDSPQDPPKPKMMSQNLASNVTLLDDARKPLAEGRHRHRAGTLTESTQLGLEDEELEYMIPIYAAAGISDDHQAGIDHATSYIAAIVSPLPDTWNMAMIEELDPIVQHQVVGDLVELPEGRPPLRSHCV